MYHVQNCLISEETIRTWEQKFVPTHDTFFFEKENQAIDLLGDDVYLLSREQWVGNKELNTLDVSTALQPWSIRTEAAFVAVVSGGAFDELSQGRRVQVFYEQWRLGRGQIFTLEWLEDEVLANVSSADHDSALDLLTRNLFDTPEGKMVALQHTLWIALPWAVRVQLLLAVAGLHVRYPSVWQDLSTAEQQRITALNPIIATHTDTFSAHNGPNCFTTALAGATQNTAQAEFLLTQWMVIEPFRHGLAQRGYRKMEDKPFAQEEIEAGDILVWSNAEDIPLHACYAVGKGLVFNTNGQTMFNPWQVLRVETLVEDWGHVVESGGSLSVYRKVQR